ncbi:MAG: IS21-like element helper ATPase IstB [Planctomycetes bacterium]|nr:IS21-like element helper ATPase IstB [Planctomycetota bacterium]
MAKTRTNQANGSPPNHSTPPPSAKDRLTEQLRELRLPAFRDHYQSQADQAARENLSYPQYLEALASRECEARTQGRIRRLAMASRLPSGKTWDQFRWARLPKNVQQQFQALRDGGFLKRRENVLVFGKPGSGKTHALCAVAEQLVLQGHPVLFTTSSLLVQDLLVAKRDLKLERFLKKLAGYEALVIDDLGYVQQSREEMEVLFTLLAERYERGSVMLTSNLPFSQWTAIFKDPMTTAAAIDRLVHHSVIVELNVPSYRLESAKDAKKAKTNDAESPATTTS